LNQPPDVRWYDSVSSTNDLALRAAERGAAEWTVMAAEHQTAGRGRLGRTWVSPAGSGLYVSVVLRPAAAVTPLVTIAAGVALADGIRAASGLAVGVKWPNDLLVSGRKLAGILAERGVGAQGAHVVLGFGINVMPAAYPPDIAARATSIEGELGRPVDRALLLTECLASLAARYRQLQEGSAATVVSAWRQRAAGGLNRPVEWDAGAGVKRGLAEDIDGDGALLVRTPSGIERIISGEVRWS
jgi:BirA family biotin operon repressor/biotin-[acetyl-CoA-carboxylase] ligase